jgi:hypothetical protein
MGMGDLVQALEPISPARQACEQAMATSTAPRYARRAMRDSRQR